MVLSVTRLVTVRQGRLPQAGVHGSSPRTASSTLDPGPMQQRGSFQQAPEDFESGSHLYRRSGTWSECLYMPEV